MMRNLLITGIAIVVISVSMFFLVRSRTSSCAAGISHGTVVIASVDKDSIVIAADSRETDIAFSQKKITFTDTAHKIFHIHNIFFAIAGLSELCKISTQSFVAHNYDTTKSIKENAPVLQAKLKKALQTELDSYSKKQKGYLAGHEYSVMLLIAGYEKGIPVFGHINTGVKFVTLFANPVESRESVSSGQRVYDVAGIHDHIYQVRYNLDGNKLQQFSNLIKLEARHHNEVDSLVQYAIIKKDGYRLSFEQQR